MANKSPGKEDGEKRRTKHHQIIVSVIKCWPAQLFIFVENSKIYAYKRLPLLLRTFSSRNAEEFEKRLIEENEETEKILMEEYLESHRINISEISTIEKDLSRSIKGNNEKKVKKRVERSGKQLYRKLIHEEIENELKEELKKDDDKNNKILICCKDKEIDYVWEWIYWKEKDFFWGDKFHIVRLSKDGISHRELKNSNFQIKKFATVSDINCNCTTKVISYFDVLIGANNYKKIKLQELSDNNLNAIDCIHFVGNIETFRNNTSLITDCGNRLNGQNTSNSNCANTQLKFLFSNIRVPASSTLEEKGSNLSQLKELLASAAEIYIDTTFDPPDDHEISFVKSFYDKFQNEKNVVEAATEARRSIGSKKPWRLAYVVRGNPCTEVTWKVALGTPEQKE